MPLRSQQRLNERHHVHALKGIFYCVGRFQLLHYNCRHARTLEQKIQMTWNTEPRIAALKVTKDNIVAHLVDGRTISVPLAWSWRLSDATPEQRNNFEIIGNGQGVHWSELDEDISARGMLYGIAARRPKRAMQTQQRKIAKESKRVNVAA